MTLCKPSRGLRANTHVISLRNCKNIFFDFFNMNEESILLKVAFKRNDQVCERQASVPRTSLGCFTSKDTLLKYILTEIFPDQAGNESKPTHYNIERKSKRHKKFVTLEKPEDFKELRRSLKVKNHVKLAVQLTGPPESPVTDALEQVRKLVGELQKSELWELLKSFTSAQGVKNEVCESAVTHDYVACDACHPDDTPGTIIGRRFKCVVCSNFDLCEKCFLSNATLLEHHSDHPMIVTPDSQRFQDHLPIPGSFSVAKCCRKVIESPISSDEKKKNDDITNEVKQYRELKMLVAGSVDKFEYIKKLIKCSILATDEIQESNLLGMNESPDSDITTRTESIQSSSSDCLKQVRPLREMPFTNSCSEMARGPELSIEATKIESAVKSADTVNLRSEILQVGQAFELAVVPKGTSLSQVILTNKSNNEFVCDELSFEITNCFGVLVASTTVQKSHNLRPGKSAKFNVIVNTTHFKWPFTVTVNNGSLGGSCELSLKILASELFMMHLKSDQFVAIPEAADGIGAASLRSTIASTQVSKSPESLESQDDFDIISLTDLDDLTLDYEVLSRVSSQEHDKC